MNLQHIFTKKEHIIFRCSLWCNKLDVTTTIDELFDTKEIEIHRVAQHANNTLG